MGKCVSNKIGHPFSFGFDVITELWQGIVATLFLVTFGIFDTLAQIGDVSRCYCQLYG